MADDLGQEQRDCFELKAAPKLSAALLVQHRGLPALLTMHFLVMLGFNFFYVTFPVFAVGVLRWSLPDTGLFFAVMGLLMVVVQGPVFGRVARRVEERTLVVGGSVMLAASFWLFDSQTTLVIYLAVALMALGNGVMWPSVLSLLSKTAGDSYQGSIQGLAGSLGAVASVAGLVLGGMLYANLGPKVLWVSAAVSLTVGLVGATRLGRPGAPPGSVPQRVLSPNRS